MREMMKIRKIIFWLSFIFFLYSPAYALKLNVSVVKELSQAYGFILGQEYTLSYINREYPDFVNNTQLAHAQFNSTFPDIKLKLETQLKLAMGEKQFNEYSNSMQKKLKEMLDRQKFTKEYSLKFLEQVKNRSKGKIEKPILEYLLIVQYEENPAQEFLDGFKQQFLTDGSGKSQGIRLKLQVPRSWASNEGERPHIVQKWRSENGNGLEMILLDIRDTDGHTPSKTEIESMLKSEEMRSTIPKGASYIDSGIFSLENQTGIWIYCQIIQERIGMRIFQEAIIYQLFFQGKAIGLMCIAQGSVEEKDAVAESFKRTRPLFKLVLNSLILKNVYN